MPTFFVSLLPLRVPIRLKINFIKTDVCTSARYFSTFFKNNCQERVVFVKMLNKTTNKFMITTDNDIKKIYKKSITLFVNKNTVKKYFGYN